MFRVHMLPKFCCLQHTYIYDASLKKQDFFVLRGYVNSSVSCTKTPVTTIYMYMKIVQ